MVAWRWLAIAACVAVAACGKKARPDELNIAGASDLVFAMDEIIPRFQSASGHRVKFVPGSSGQLAAQIAEGAPYDVFFSANVAFVDEVIASGDCLADSKALYARGRIVMWAREGAAVQPPAELAGLVDPRYVKIAIANPEHAPYGTAAKQALERTGIWSAVEPRIVYGSNIRDAMHLVDSGNAELGIVALSLAVKSDGAFVEIPAALHEPIDQAMVVCKRGGAERAGRAFIEFMRTPETRRVMQSYGFAVPE